MIYKKNYIGQEKAMETYLKNYFLCTIVESTEHDPIPLYSTVFS